MGWRELRARWRRVSEKQQEKQSAQKSRQFFAAQDELRRKMN